MRYRSCLNEIEPRSQAEPLSSKMKGPLTKSIAVAQRLNASFLRQKVTLIVETYLRLGDSPVRLAGGQRELGSDQSTGSSMTEPNAEEREKEVGGRRADGVMESSRTDPLLMQHATPANTIMKESRYPSTASRSLKEFRDHRKLSRSVQIIPARHDYAACNKQHSQTKNKCHLIKKNIRPDTPRLRVTYIGNEAQKNTPQTKI